jgi:hypothetical protein
MKQIPFGPEQGNRLGVVRGGKVLREIVAA